MNNIRFSVILYGKLKIKHMKYICTVCEYIYDPELGDPESGIEPVQPSKTFQMIGYVRSVG